MWVLLENLDLLLQVEAGWWLNGCASDIPVELSKFSCTKLDAYRNPVHFGGSYNNDISAQVSQLEVSQISSNMLDDVPLVGKFECEAVRHTATPSFNWHIASIVVN